FGPAQAAVARAVMDSVSEGVISKTQANDLCILVGVFIHWQAEDDKKIFQFNYTAVKESIARALKGTPTVDAGADEVMSYGGITEGDVRDLIHGCIFTRGPKDLKNTAVWIGGNNMSAGEQLLAIALDSVFGPFKVSMMLDSNGSNTTAVAAVVRIEQAVGDLQGKSAVILAGT